MNDVSKLIKEHDAEIRESTIEECILEISTKHTHSAYSADVHEAILLLEKLKRKIYDKS